MTVLLTVEDTHEEITLSSASDLSFFLYSGLKITQSEISSTSIYRTPRSKLRQLKKVSFSSWHFFIRIVKNVNFILDLRKLVK